MPYENTTAEIIASIDAGSTASERWLEKIVEPMLQDPAVQAVGGWRPLNARNDFQKQMARYSFFPQDRWPAGAACDPSAGNSAFRRAAFFAAGGYPEWMTFAGEDFLFNATMNRLGLKIYYQPEALTLWEGRPDWRSYGVMVRRYGFGLGEMRVFPKNYWGWLLTTIFPPLILFSRHPLGDAWLRWVRNANSVWGWFTGRLFGHQPPPDWKFQDGAWFGPEALAFRHGAEKKMKRPEKFAMACFARSGDDNFARALEHHGLLDFYALGTRRGAAGIPPEHTRLKPVFGLANYVLARTLPTFTAESLRFRMFGAFDRWTQSLLSPGQNFFTGYAFAPGAMRRVKTWEGLAFMDAWTSHPAEFWELLTDEQKIWKSKFLPVSQHYQNLVVESVAAADYICVASSFIKNSFLKRGHPAEKLLVCPYPVDLSAFQPDPAPRPASRPFTILHTGGLSLRKGAPYLFEAFRLIRREVPNAVLRIKRHLRDEVRDIVKRNADLPIEWSDSLDFAGHVRRYQTSDLLLFPSIEDGFAFVVAEALACGLPVVTTTNTGAADLIQPGINGEVAPIRDARALADGALKWWEKIQRGERIGGRAELMEKLSFTRFEENFIGHLRRIGINSRH